MESFDANLHVVLVTGGSSGIGRGIVATFVDRGWCAVFCSNQETEGKQLEKEINESNPNHCTFINYDATKEESIKIVIEKTVTKYGRLDCLVNNVGIHPPHKPIDAVSASEFQQVFDVNVMSYFLTIKYALPHLRKTKGSVINVASLVASLGQSHGVTYCATKGAIVSMTKALAIDEACHGVRINSISPSNIWTPMWEAAAQTESSPEIAKRRGQESQLLNRYGTPEECGKACFFLALDATFMTGTDLLVTGGAEIGYGNKAIYSSSHPENSLQ